MPAMLPNLARRVVLFTSFLIVLFIPRTTDGPSQARRTVKVGKPVAAQPVITDSVRLSEAYGKLPMSFEPNQGQSETSVKFLSRGRGYGLFLTSAEAVLTLSKTARNDEPDGGARSAVLRMRLN